MQPAVAIFTDVLLKVERWGVDSNNRVLPPIVIQGFKLLSFCEANKANLQTRAILLTPTINPIQAIT